MNHLSRIATLCLCLATTVGCQTMSSPKQAADSGSQEVAAEVNGQVILVGELDAFIKDELFAQNTGNGAASKLYDLRMGSIQRMVDSRVIDDAAKAAGVSGEQLMAYEATKSGGVTDADVIDYFAEVSLQGTSQQVVRYLGLRVHFDELVSGVVKTDDLVYFGVVVVFFVSGARAVTESLRWR